MVFATCLAMEDDMLQGVYAAQQADIKSRGDLLLTFLKTMGWQNG